MTQFFAGRGLSEVEQVDKILRRQRRGAAFGVVGRARVACVLRRRKTKAGAAINPRGFAALIGGLITRENERAHLPEEDVAVRAEMQRVAVLLPARIAPAQLEVHLLPLQVTLVAHHQTLSDLRAETQTKTSLSGRRLAKYMLKRLHWFQLEHQDMLNEELGGT